MVMYLASKLLSLGKVEGSVIDKVGSDRRLEIKQLWEKQELRNE